MSRILSLLVALLALGFALPGAASAATNVIVDTDIQGDTDDAGALAVLHALADDGEANILGVVVDTRSNYGPSAVDAINTFYGRPNVPIGHTKSATAPNPGGAGGYAQTLSTTFPQDIGTTGGAPNGVTLYRQLLASQPDGSVVIASLGFLNVLSDLLSSPADGISPLTGTQLVGAKVKLLAVMGGIWPNGTDTYNFGLAKTPAGHVLNTWPGRMMVSGLGANVWSASNGSIRTLPTSNPVRKAYEIFPGSGTNYARPSWDQVVVLAAVRGPSGFATEQGTTGSVTYDTSTGANGWNTSVDKQHSWLQQTVSDAALADTITTLMRRPPNIGQPANGTYRVTVQHSGKVLDVNLCSATGQVQQYTWLNNACQRWILARQSDGYYRLTSLATGKVLEVTGGSTANNAAVGQATWSGADHQRWAVYAESGGWVRLAAKHSGHVLDVPSFSTADGEALWQYPWLGGTNQKWQLQLAP